MNQTIKFWKQKISQVSVQLAKLSEVVSHKQKCRKKQCEMQRYNYVVDLRKVALAKINESGITLIETKLIEDHL